MFLSPTNITTGMGVTSNATGAAGFILDQLPGADVALSLRRLSTAYNGPIMRIRREDDDEEADVHFNARHYFSLDSPVDNFSSGSSSTNLGEFLDSADYDDPDGLGSATSAYMTKWYDQSGGGHDALQTSTASYQPRIVNSSNLGAGEDGMSYPTGGTAAGTPATYQDGTTLMDGTQWGTISQPNSIALVGQDSTAGSGSNKYFWEGTTSGTRCIVGAYYNNDDSGLYSGGSDFLIIEDSNKTAGNKIYFGVWNGSSSIFRLQDEDIYGTVGSNAQYGFRLFKAQSGSGWMTGYTLEVIFWPTNQGSLSARTSQAQNDFYQRY
jgi:hypothetical protein